ncbi:uncharacterized protein B0I36DRAFT_319454 [Microdochium trichocladiopsis]|uniref:Secreted protein n=1 Tax=Microdochium trichocladiopsis TaxID=1682393 RepID=A0A9P8YDL1_9PEZI|nr:uncharacterized protein B0I36DRAFT_319454 [Microdochium trichocladiopsis]KAH7035960.1 hypothetical protein B0I36DRAFT_319454 [Microdochium trichocladiopsis]
MLLAAGILLVVSGAMVSAFAFGGAGAAMSSSCLPFKTIRREAVGSRTISSQYASKRKLHSLIACIRRSVRSISRSIPNNVSMNALPAFEPSCGFSERDCVDSVGSAEFDIDVDVDVEEDAVT